MERDRVARERLVEHLERNGALTDARVKAALLTVPRHRFVPQLTIDDAYADRAIAIKERDGSVVSSISQPSMVVQMLELLDVHPGDAALEIGTGSGYNAALLAHLAGRDGVVVTVDVERDLVERATATFQRFDIPNAAAIMPDEIPRLTGPFDRVVVTARASDIDAQWWRLLREGGSIVVPLDIGYGGERVIGFVREGHVLRSVGSYACAFIGMRDGDPEAGDLFFPNRRLRYGQPPPPTAPVQVLAMAREAANAGLSEDADVIVARPHTIFALNYS